jgi:hypothetical protein
MPEKLYVADFDDRPYQSENNFIVAIPPDTLVQLKKDKVTEEMTIKLVNPGKTECVFAKIVTDEDTKTSYFHCHWGSRMPYDPNAPQSPLTNMPATEQVVAHPAPAVKP